MKRVVIGVVAVMCVFFIAGGVAAYLGRLDKEVYIVATGVVGGLASVIGLIGLLAKPALTARDMKAVEVELVSELATTMKEVKEYEERISSNKQEIDRLQEDRAKIELLVRQAALKVFLEERLRNLSEEIEKRLEADTTLARMVSEYFSVKEQVISVDGEIKESGRAEEIYEIIRKAMERPPVRSYPPGVAGLIVEIAEFAGKTLAEVILPTRRR